MLFQSHAMQIYAAPKFKILRPKEIYTTRWFKYDRDKLWPVYT
jgi:hypothetical protein